MQETQQEIRRCTRCDILKELTVENFRKTRYGLTWVCRNCRGPRNCAEIGCKKENPRYSLDKNSERFCHQHGKIERELLDVRNIRCKFVQCTKQPSYNFEGESHGIFCREHAESGMVDVVHPRCHFSGCSIRPSYNFEGETRGIFCREHAESGMVDVQHPRCQFAGCIIRPSYNFEGETRGIFCREHAESGMVDVISKICKFAGCLVQPSYNFEGESHGIFCREHAESGMVDVRSKRCETIGCLKIASYNFPKNNGRRFCRDHAENGMVNAAGRQCHHENCTKQTLKGFPGNSATRCAEHRLPGMISYPNSRCTFRHENGRKCTELAIYGVTRALHCESHREATENNLIEQTCIRCGLVSVVDPQGVCGYCDPSNGTRVHLAKQRTVQAFLDRRIAAAEIPGYNSYDRQLDSGVCGRERPDFLWDCGGWYVIMEVDEDQHDSRQERCEINRMKNIGQSLGGPSVWFLRYNPDPYRSNGRKQNPTQSSRHKTLLRILKRLLAESPPETDFITARYLYYDGYTKNSIRQTSVESLET